MNNTNNTNNTNTINKLAIVVLTRGYTDIKKYEMLIQRNIAIDKNLTNKSVDILIFHEGNILEPHQQYICKFTPRLNIQFICIKEYAFKNEKNQITHYSPSSCWDISYRHMCSFWFVDFWNYVENYDQILRIDEDCIIDFNVMQIFQMLQYKCAVYGEWKLDQDFVTLGLNKFTQGFLKENIQIMHQIPPHRPSGPYTNVIGLNLHFLRQNRLIKQYIEKVKMSENIYIYRWGDLPLWGEVLFYLCDKNRHIKTELIKYYHGSHDYFVGGDNPKKKLRKMMV